MVEERAQEEKDQEIADLKAECDRLAAEVAELEERYDGFNAARIGPMKIAATETEGQESFIDATQTLTSAYDIPGSNIALNEV